MTDFPEVRASHVPYSRNATKSKSQASHLSAALKGYMVEGIGMALLLGISLTLLKGRVAPIKLPSPLVFALSLVGGCSVGGYFFYQSSSKAEVNNKDLPSPTFAVEEKKVSQWEKQQQLLQFEEKFDKVLSSEKKTIRELLDNCKTIIQKNQEKDIINIAKNYIFIRDNIFFSFDYILDYAFLDYVKMEILHSEENRRLFTDYEISRIRFYHLKAEQTLAQ